MMRDAGGPDETKSLVDWVLERHPETPKTRAKQWIQSGRVSVHSVVIRKPHHLLTDPGDALELLHRHAMNLECGTPWQIHSRVALVYLDWSFAIVNKGPGLISVPAPNCELSALSILADFLAGRLKAQDRGVAGKTVPPVYRRAAAPPGAPARHKTRGGLVHGCQYGAAGEYLPPTQKAHDKTGDS